MGTYIARRLLWVPVLLLIVSFITFALGRFGPGDPVQILLGQNFRQDAYDRIRKQQGPGRSHRGPVCPLHWQRPPGGLRRKLPVPGPERHRSAEKQNLDIRPAQLRRAADIRHAGNSGRALRRPPAGHLVGQRHGGIHPGGSIHARLPHHTHRPAYIFPEAGYPAHPWLGRVLLHQHYSSPRWCWASPAWRLLPA